MFTEWTQLLALIAAAGALGGAAYGLVDAARFRPLRAVGFGALRKQLGEALQAALAKAYGDEDLKLLEAQYVDREHREELERSLRQGLRLGFAPETAVAMARAVGMRAAEETLQDIARKVADGDELDDGERNLLARFEMALDARVDAGLSLADLNQRQLMRWLAMAAAVGIALLGAHVLKGELEDVKNLYGRAVVLGFIAVPLAPVANDLAAALRAVAEGLRAGRGK